MKGRLRKIGEVHFSHRGGWGNWVILDKVEVSYIRVRRGLICTTTIATGLGHQLVVTRLAYEDLIHLYMCRVRIASFSVTHFNGNYRGSVVTMVGELSLPVLS